MNEEQPTPFLRLFIAIAVPLEVRKEIGRAQDQLRRDSRQASIRWTRPEQFHVTLKFLGDVLGEQVEALKTAVSKVCTGFSAIKLSAHGIGFFPSEKRPRVIWAGIENESGQLVELNECIDAAVWSFAPSTKAERFAGHITLGRFKPGFHSAIPKLHERASVLGYRHFGDWQALEVEIVRSKLTSTGALHTAIASCPLA